MGPHTTIEPHPTRIAFCGPTPEPQISAQEGAGLAHRIRGGRDICGHALLPLTRIVEIMRGIRIHRKCDVDSGASSAFDEVLASFRHFFVRSPDQHADGRVLPHLMRINGAPGHSCSMCMSFVAISCRQNR